MYLYVYSIDREQSVPKIQFAVLEGRAPRMDRLDVDRMTLVVREYVTRCQSDSQTTRPLC